MYKRKIGCKAFALTIVLFSFLNLNHTEAGIVKVINENFDPIRLVVIPEPACEEAPYCWKCLSGPCNVPRKQVAELLIPSDCLRGRECYAIIGTTGGFLFNGECRNLSVFKNYEVKFLDDFLGTSCIAREI